MRVEIPSENIFFTLPVPTMSETHPIRFEFIRVASSTEIGQNHPLELPSSAFSNARGSFREVGDLKKIEDLGRQSAKEMMAAFYS